MDWHTAFIIIVGVPAGLCAWALVLQEQRDEARARARKLERLNSNFQSWRR